MKKLKNHARLATKNKNEENFFYDKILLTLIKEMKKIGSMDEHEIKITKILLASASNELNFQDALKQLLDLFKGDEVKPKKKTKKVVKETTLKEVHREVDLKNVNLLKPTKLFRVEMNDYGHDVYLLAHGYDEAAENSIKIKKENDEKKGILDEDGNVRTPKDWKVRKVELLTDKLHNI